MSASEAETGKSKVLVIPECGYDQVLNTENYAFENLPAQSISLSSQSNISYPCHSFPNSSLKNKLIAHSLCPFTCPPLLFGPSCLSCSSYMLSLSRGPSPGYTWDATSSSTCRQTKINQSLSSCSSLNSCSECMIDPLCNWEDSQCQRGQVARTNKWWEIQSLLCSVYEHSERFCGASWRDLREFDWKELKPWGKTPKNTICTWRLASPVKFNLTVDIPERADLFQVVIEYESSNLP